MKLVSASFSLPKLLSPTLTHSNSLSPFLSDSCLLPSPFSSTLLSLPLFFFLPLYPSLLTFTHSLFLFLCPYPLAPSFLLSNNTDYLSTCPQMKLSHSIPPYLSPSFLNHIFFSSPNHLSLLYLLYLNFEPLFSFISNSLSIFNPLSVKYI